MRRPDISDFDELDPDSISQLLLKADEPVIRQIGQNAALAWPFWFVLIIWFAIATLFCQYGFGDIQPKFAVSVVDETHPGKLGTTQIVYTKLKRPTALYFNAAMLTSVGATDITPLNRPARAVSLIDSAVGYLLLALIMSVVALSFEGTTSIGRTNILGAMMAWFSFRKKKEEEKAPAPANAAENDEPINFHDQITRLVRQIRVPDAENDQQALTRARALTARAYLDLATAALAGALDPRELENNDE